MLASRQPGSLHITSVDSSAPFATALNISSEPIQKAVQAGLLSLRVVDIGTASRWGYPANWTDRSTEARHALGTAYATAGGVLMGAQSKWSSGTCASRGCSSRTRHAGKDALCRRHCHPPGRDALFDVVFVDGRWRLACALQARWLLAPNGTLIVHDYNRYSRQLSEWYYPQRVVGQLAVLKSRTWKSPQTVQQRPDLTSDLSR